MYFKIEKSHNQVDETGCFDVHWGSIPALPITVSPLPFECYEFDFNMLRCIYKDDALRFRVRLTTQVNNNLDIDMHFARPERGRYHMQIGRAIHQQCIRVCKANMPEELQAQTNIREVVCFAAG